jgi:hypothetical protein
MTASDDSSSSYADFAGRPPKRRAIAPIGNFRAMPDTSSSAIEDNTSFTPESPDSPPSASAGAELAATLDRELEAGQIRGELMRVVESMVDKIKPVNLEVAGSNRAKSRLRGSRLIDSGVAEAREAEARVAGVKVAEIDGADLNLAEPRLEIMMV